MTTEANTDGQPFVIIGTRVSNDAWTGSPATLAVNDTAVMPQTPNGSTVLAWQNTGDGNNDGTLVLTSGGAAPIFEDAPALANQPSILVQNWHANNLKLTNVSANNDTPIWVSMFGPGIPNAAKPTPLPIGTPLALEPGVAAAGTAKPAYMQFVLTSNSPDLTIVTLIGGPRDKSGNNAYVFAVNFPDSGDETGYTKVTGSNSLTFQFNWGSSGLYVANMSPGTAADAQVLLRAL